MIIGGCARKGQDSSATFVNEAAGMRGVILADGLGSCSKARETADFIVNETRNQFEVVSCLDAEKLKEIFLVVHARMLEWIGSDYSIASDMGVRSGVYGSTLIVAVEKSESFLVGYVGNGAIWHIRGNAFHNHGNRLLPWSIANLLNPHTVPENGVEALYKYFSASADQELVRPTVLEFSKDSAYGDVLLVCTDGISSNDQVSIGKVESGIWTNVEDALVTFLDMLVLYLPMWSQPGKLEELRDAYAHWLQGAPQVEDDATFGILLCLPSLRPS